MNGLLFAPLDGATKSISAGVASANVAVSTKADSVRVFNDSDTTIFIAFGTSSSVTAGTSADIPIDAGEKVIFDFPSNTHTHIAAIVSSGSSKTIYFTPGYVR